MNSTDRITTRSHVLTDAIQAAYQAAHAIGWTLYAYDSKTEQVDGMYEYTIWRDLQPKPVTP